MTTAEKTKADVLLDLAERCETGGPDFETDGDIKLAIAAEMIAAGKSKDEVVSAVGGDLYSDPRRYTASIDEAVMIVPDGFRWEIDSIGYKLGVYQHGKARAVVMHPFSSGGDPRWVAFARTPALAICAAALRARAAMEK